VFTLTNSLHRENPFGDRLRAVPFIFMSQRSLPNHCAGFSVLYNTYWCVFNHMSFTHADAVSNTLTLFDAA